VVPVEVVETHAVNEPLKFKLQGIEHVHPYLVGRGFEEEECEYLGVGFFPGKGSMAGRIVFPIHNEDGSWWRMRAAQSTARSRAGNCRRASRSRWSSTTCIGLRATR
jgi:hypothetical protein